MKATTPTAWLLGAVLLLSNTSAFGFAFKKNYPTSDSLLRFYVDIPGVSDNGISWNDAFDMAVADWNTRLSTPITVVREYRDICGEGDYSAAGFTENFCGLGDDFEGIAGLAWSALRSVGDGTFVRYKARIGFSLAGGGIRYLASHELGHALGLSHSVFPGSTVPTRGRQTRRLTGPSIDDFCGVAVLNGEPDDCEIFLPDVTRVDGEDSAALFFGGASTDKGISYTTQVSIADTLDVVATVVVEPEHIAKGGKLYVVAVLEDGSLLAQNSTGSFVPHVDGDALPAAESKSLNGANELYILEDIDLATVGIVNQSIAIFLGYSIDAEPDNIIYSTTPIRFTIFP